MYTTDDLAKVTNKNLLTDYEITLKLINDGFTRPGLGVGEHLSIVRKEILRRMGG